MSLSSATLLLGSIACPSSWAAANVDRVELDTASHIEVHWRDLVEGVRQGLPQQGVRGLGRSSAWGRTYWGGALFCLRADVQIRQRTHDQKGLEHALRAVLVAGGTLDQDWPIARVIEIGDR